MNASVRLRDNEYHRAVETARDTRRESEKIIRQSQQLCAESRRIVAESSELSPCGSAGAAAQDR